MANSTASTRPTATQHKQPRKPKRPDPRLVYQTFCYERDKKAWGAATRTAQAHSISDDTVARVVARYEQDDTIALELEYRPLDARYEQDQPVLAQQQLAETRPETLRAALQALHPSIPIQDVSTPENATELPRPYTTAPAYVAPRLAELSQPVDVVMREFVMSNEGTSEREMRKFDPLPRPAAPELSQDDSVASRISERENLSQNPADSPQLARTILEPFPNPDPLPGPVPPPIPNPMPDPLPPEPIPPIVERGISLRDDYARRRTTPDAAARYHVPALDWGQLVAYVGPVLLLAFLLYEIVLSATR